MIFVLVSFLAFWTLQSVTLRCSPHAREVRYELVPSAAVQLLSVLSLIPEDYFPNIGPETGYIEIFRVSPQNLQECS
jgi:hypothetical protein